MSRPLRIAFENAVYHIMARGNRRGPIFFADGDRRKFLVKLEAALKRRKAELFAYCLMPNHYHLFLRTLRPNLSSLVHDINSSYVNWLKAKHGLIGVVFQGRFKSIVVDASAYATVLSTYIHLNPLRRKLVEKPEDYPWSSYRDYLGLRRTGLKSLRPAFVLSEFNEAESVARAQYRSFLEARVNLKDPLAEFRRCTAAGSEAFQKTVKSKIRPSNYREINAEQSVEKPEVIADRIFLAMAKVLGVAVETIRRPKQRNHFRPMGIYLMKKHCPIDLKSVAAYWRMDYAAASISAIRFESRIQNNPEAAAALKNIEALIEIY
jgi:putative transposase